MDKEETEAAQDFAVTHHTLRPVRGRRLRQTVSDSSLLKLACSEFDVDAGLTPRQKNLVGAVTVEVPRRPRPPLQRRAESARELAPVRRAAMDPSSTCRKRVQHASSWKDSANVNGILKQHNGANANAKRNAFTIGEGYPDSVEISSAEPIRSSPIIDEVTADGQQSVAIAREQPNNRAKHIFPAVMKEVAQRALVPEPSAESKMLTLTATLPHGVDLPDDGMISSCDWRSFMPISRRDVKAAGRAMLVETKAMSQEDRALGVSALAAAPAALGLWCTYSASSRLSLPPSSWVP